MSRAPHGTFRLPARQLLSTRPTVLWLTGIPAAGKTTIARAMQAELDSLGYSGVVLDGDELRRGLSRDLGFSDLDRLENVRRTAEVARLFCLQGCIVLAALISPRLAHRALAQQIIGSDAFVEVFVDTPLALAEARDPKGLYRQARNGELSGFTGIDAAYEAPPAPQVRLTTASMSCGHCVQTLLACLSLRNAVT
ncbi:adenylyl-sulfate kinase [Pseudomonas coleopterorum]|uniref:Adenylyl-sulfate kinase n=1 Tax=Pseudomonas coleopterorum TaxID=1605838 RepID=A0AAJ6M170_9PSED|nr:adenylyl-sulfate kinase [Pseudomonas coleopterorum]WNC10440.1 adenylyl-sulfate kinase [Pseudomonas coleopterorum]